MPRQDETRHIQGLGLGATYIRDLVVTLLTRGMVSFITAIFMKIESYKHKGNTDFTLVVIAW